MLDSNHAQQKDHTNLFIKETLESNEKEERLHAIFMRLINIFLTRHLYHITLEKCGLIYLKPLRICLILLLFLSIVNERKKKEIRAEWSRVRVLVSLKC